MVDRPGIFTLMSSYLRPLSLSKISLASLSEVHLDLEARSNGIASDVVEGPESSVAVSGDLDSPDEPPDMDLSNSWETSMLERDEWR